MVIDNRNGRVVSLKGKVQPDKPCYDFMRLLSTALRLVLLEGRQGRLGRA